MYIKSENISYKSEEYMKNEKSCFQSQSDYLSVIALEVAHIRRTRAVTGLDAPASSLDRLSRLIRAADPRYLIAEPALTSARNSGDLEKLSRLADELRALAMPPPIFEVKRQLVDASDPLSYAASRWDWGAWATLQPILEEVNLMPKNT